MHSSIHEHTSPVSSPGRTGNAMTVLHGLITLADVGDTSLRNNGNHTHTQHARRFEYFNNSSQHYAAGIAQSLQ